MNRVRRFSMRLRLTAAFLLMLAVVIGLFAFALYASVRHNLAREVDEYLVSEAVLTSDTIFAFWKAESEEGVLTPPGLFTEIPDERFSDLIGRWALDLHQASRPVRILDPSGRPVFSSPHFVVPEIPSRDLIRRLGTGLYLHETRQAGSQRYRILTFPVIENHRILYVIQTLAPLRQVQASLDGLKWSLLTFVPLILLVVGVMGWMVVAAALRPVNLMTEQARRISARELGERIRVPTSGDELERLAETLNGLLDRLERSFKRLRQFSAAASHELRTPLGVLRGELEVTLRRDRDPEEYRKVMKRLLELAGEMQGTVTQLLALAYAEEGEGEVSRKPLELRDAVEAAAKLWSRVAQEKGVRLRVLCGTPGRMLGERSLIDRLVSNLIDNAIKHTPAGGEVQVDLVETAAEIGLRVSDTGPGIPAGESEGIFDRFFRREAAESKGGVGLGLGLCRWIAEAHNGRISYMPNRPHGAVFSVTFPSPT